MVCLALQQYFSFRINQQTASSTFLSKQISTSNQPNEQVAKSEFAYELRLFWTELMDQDLGMDVVSVSFRGLSGIRTSWPVLAYSSWKLISMTKEACLG
jgi:hypothetical protein